MRSSLLLLVAAVGFSPAICARAGDAQAAARYAEAVILEARVAESVSAVRRVLNYTHAFHLEAGEGDEALARFDEALTAARVALQADRERPAFETFDYGAIDRPLRRAAVESASLLATLADKLRLKLGVRDAPSSSTLAWGERGRAAESDLADAALEYCLQVASLSGETSDSLPLCLGPNDAAIVSQLGVRVVSPAPAVFGGRNLWPTPDPFDFAAMDALVAGNASEGFQTEIRLGPLDQVPEEILSQGSLAAAGPDGLISPEPDIFNPKARNLVLGFAQAIAGHFRGQSAVARYILFDPPDLRNAGYTDAARAAFRGWLQTRYVSLDKLNEQWKARYVNWSDIQPPAASVGAYTRPEAALAGEFARFKADSLTLFLGDAAAALRAADPDCPLGTRFTPRGSAAEDLASRGLNWNTLAQGPWDAFGLSGLGQAPPLSLRRFLSAAAATRQKPKTVRVLRASPYDWLAAPDAPAQRLTSRGPRAQ
ncbi:MAG: beta-galactosidase, partial [Candidatus Sumerlaeota bacterium]|nr:beta-galactosidase [Candidatus Sumerlaeota bacterium]